MRLVVAAMRSPSTLSSSSESSPDWSSSRSSVTRRFASSSFSRTMNPVPNPSANSASFATGERYRAASATEATEAASRIDPPESPRSAEVNDPPRAPAPKRCMASAFFDVARAPRRIACASLRLIEFWRFRRPMDTARSEPTWSLTSSFARSLSAKASSPSSAALAKLRASLPLSLRAAAFSAAAPGDSTKSSASRNDGAELRRSRGASPEASDPFPDPPPRERCEPPRPGDREPTSEVSLDPPAPSRRKPESKSSWPSGSSSSRSSRMAFEYRPNRSAPEPHPSSRSTTAAFFSRRLAPGANPRSWWNTRTKGASTCALGLDDSARERFPATAPEPKNARPWNPPPPSPPRPPPWPPLEALNPPPLASKLPSCSLDPLTLMSQSLRTSGRSSTARAARVFPLLGGPSTKSNLGAIASCASATTRFAARSVVSWPMSGERHERAEIVGSRARSSVRAVAHAEEANASAVAAARGSSEERTEREPPSPGSSPSSRFRASEPAREPAPEPSEPSIERSLSLECLRDRPPN